MSVEKFAPKPKIEVGAEPIVHNFHAFATVTCICRSPIPISVPLIPGAVTGIKCMTCGSTLKIDQMVFKTEGEEATMALGVTATPPLIAPPR